MRLNESVDLILFYYVSLSLFGERSIRRNSEHGRISKIESSSFRALTSTKVVDDNFVQIQFTILFCFVEKRKQ